MYPGFFWRARVAQIRKTKRARDVDAGFEITQASGEQRFHLLTPDVPTGATQGSASEDT